MTAINFLAQPQYTGPSSRWTHVLPARIKGLRIKLAAVFQARNSGEPLPNQSDHLMRDIGLARHPTGIGRDSDVALRAYASRL